MTDRNAGADPERRSEASERFIARVQPEGAWRWGVTGWLMLALGGGMVASAMCGVCVLGSILLDTPWSVIVVVAGVLLVFAASGALCLWYGVVTIRIGRHLKRLDWIAVDRHGIGEYDGEWRITPWRQIRHIVWPHRPDSLHSSARFALVDIGTGSGARSTDGTPLTAVLDFARFRRRYACHLPVDGLNVEAGELLRAIRHFSQGRFPDL